MFPRMRTSSTTKTQHPTPKHKTCSLECALHQQPKLNTQHLNTKHVPPDAHFINNQHSTPNNRTNIYTSSSPNIQHL